MKGKLTRGAPFTDWIRELIALRAKTSGSAVRAGIARGIGMLVRSGTTCVGDITQTSLPIPLLSKKGLRSVAFHETLGLDNKMAGQRYEDLGSRVSESTLSEPGPVLIAVAPHAVYSTSIPLMRILAQYSRREGCPLSIHLAETREENEFSRHGKGPFRDLLLSMGQYEKGWEPGKRPVEAVRAAKALKGALVVHFNHPSSGDIGLLEQAGAKVAYCPNSNKWFGRKVKHPLPRLLKRGITVGLGTDSLASNTGLDMRAEMRTALTSFPQIGRQEMFRIATQGGARALGFIGQEGTLLPGAPFDAAAIKIKIGPRQDPLRSIIESRANYSRLWVNGRRISLR